MNHCIVQRTASTFGDQEWREVPWIDTVKGVEQMIFDYGLRLGGFLEIADTLSKGESSFSDVETLSRELAEISNNIQNLREQYLSPGEGSSRSVSAKIHDSQQATSPASHPSLSPNIVALGIQLVACATGYAVTSGFSVTNSINPRPFDLQTTMEWFDNKRITLALEICQTSASYINNGKGIMGPNRIIFPLRLAFEQLEKPSNEYLECRALLQKLEGKGMEFIPALNRNESIASSIIHHKRLFTALKSATS